MIPDTISDIFQPMNDFFYGLDVEIRPKLTPGAGTPRWALAAILPGWGNMLVRDVASNMKQDVFAKLPICHGHVTW